MNRQMNLPALQRIAREFERENDIMDQRQEMMDDAIDDSMGVDDEDESEEVVNQVLDEIGVDLGQAVSIVGRQLQLYTDRVHLVWGNTNKYSKQYCCRRQGCSGSWWRRPRR